ncbi:Protein of unknown function [Gryllus bimaculatus]|nr:Protein of unknown function [Gryllus bimaculatus]
MVNLETITLVLARVTPTEAKPLGVIASALMSNTEVLRWCEGMQFENMLQQKAETNLESSHCSNSTESKPLNCWADMPIPEHDHVGYQGQRQAKSVLMEIENFVRFYFY